MNKYDFTLKSDQSCKAAQKYMVKYGEYKTMKKLVEALGEDTIVCSHQSVFYTFKNHQGIVEIREGNKKKTILFHASLKKDKKV